MAQTHPFAKLVGRARKRRSPTARCARHHPSLARPAYKVLETLIAPIPAELWPQLDAVGFAVEDPEAGRWN
jgi:hypothetical protein